MHIAIGVVAVLFLIGGGALAGRGIGKARARAQEAACRANLRQVSMAMLLYLADHDDRFPPVERWSRGLYPYVRNDLVFSCPALGRKWRGFAMNRGLSMGLRGALARPAETPVLFETRIGGRRQPLEGRDPAAHPSAAAYRHPGGAFYACADGRVYLARKDTGLPPPAGLQRGGAATR